MPRHRKRYPGATACRRKVAMFLLFAAWVKLGRDRKDAPEGRDPVVDPETAKPCSIGTIDGGVRVPLAECKEQAARDTETLKGGKHPAGAREAKKRAAAC